MFANNNKANKYIYGSKATQATIPISTIHTIHNANMYSLRRIAYGLLRYNVQKTRIIVFYRRSALPLNFELLPSLADIDIIGSELNLLSSTANSLLKM